MLRKLELCFAPRLLSTEHFDAGATAVGSPGRKGSQIRRGAVQLQVPANHSDTLRLWFGDLMPLFLQRVSRTPPRNLHQSEPPIRGKLKHYLDTCFNELTDLGGKRAKTP